MFIVFEGIDGSGKATQAKLLTEFLKKNKIPSEFIHSPDYSTPVGTAYRNYLYDDFHMESDAVFLLCGCDVIINKPKIERAKSQNKVIVANRYITSTIAYQCANGFPFEKALDFVKLMKYPGADLIIFVDISAETSMKRKTKEKGVLDRHERNFEYLKKVREFYLKEVERNVLGRWIVVNGEKSIEDLQMEIIRIVKPLLKGRIKQE